MKSRYFVNFMMLAALVVLSVQAAQAQRNILPMKIRDATGSEVGGYAGSYALLVGVSDYNAGWPDLPGVDAELDKVQRALEAQGFTVRWVRNPNGRELGDAFEDFIYEYGYDRDNRLFFFFSGHGHSLDNGDKGYLVPADAPDPRKDEREFRRKSLDMTQLLSWSRQMNAKHALFLFDSCFSGTIFKTKSLPDTPPYISSLTARPVRQFITAGEAGEIVPSKSVFTPAFVDALEYGLGDLNKDGYVTGMELGLFLQGEVPKYTSQTPQYGKIQDYDLSRGDFVFTAQNGIEETAPIVGDTWTEPVTGMEFVRVPGGCFQMGSNTGESDEKPVHEVCVDGFWMGKYEVTRGQFRRFVEATGYQTDAEKQDKVWIYTPTAWIWEEKSGYNWRNLGYYQDDRHPVALVSYNDAQAFISWLEANSSMEFRLPSEAEWEYAARARTTSNWFWGDSLSEACSYANASDKGHWTGDGIFSCDDGYKFTAPVGTYKSNAFGLNDMVGNVREWCEDWYDANAYSSHLRKNPINNNISKYRVLRGGNWYFNARYVRSASRGRDKPDFCFSYIGFRLVGFQQN